MHVLDPRSPFFTMSVAIWLSYHADCTLVSYRNKVHCAVVWSLLRTFLAVRNTAYSCRHGIQVCKARCIVSMELEKDMGTVTSVGRTSNSLGP